MQLQNEGYGLCNKFYFYISFENIEKSEIEKACSDGVRQILDSILPQVAVMQLSLFLV